MTKLAKLMSEKSLTDAALAELARAPEPEIWRLRRGPHNRGQKMTLTWANRLAAALKVDVSDLLDDDPASNAAEAEVTGGKEVAAPTALPTPPTRRGVARAATRGGEETLCRDDLRVIHGLVSACALSHAPDVSMSAEAFRNLIDRAVENAAYHHEELSALADRIAAALMSESLER